MWIFAKFPSNLLSSCSVLKGPENWRQQVSSSRTLVNRSDCKVYVYIFKRNYRLGGMLFTICKAQLHVSATNVGHFQVVQKNLSIIYTCICRGCVGCRGEV